MILVNHLSFLTYGLIIFVCGNTYATTLSPVVVLQKKAVQRITYFNRDAHSSPLFSQLGLIKLMDLVTINTALFMFQFHHNLLPKAFDNFLSLIYCLSMGIVKLLGLHSPDDQTQPSYGYSARLLSKSTYYIDQVSTNYSKFNIHSMHIATWRLGWLAPLVTFHKSLALK